PRNARLDGNRAAVVVGLRGGGWGAQETGRCLRYVVRLRGIRVARGVARIRNETEAAKEIDPDRCAERAGHRGNHPADEEEKELASVIGDPMKDFLSVSPEVSDLEFFALEA